MTKVVNHIEEAAKASKTGNDNFHIIIDSKNNKCICGVYGDDRIFCKDVIESLPKIEEHCRSIQRDYYCPQYMLKETVLLVRILKSLIEKR